MLRTKVNPVLLSILGVVAPMGCSRYQPAGTSPASRTRWFGRWVSGRRVRGFELRTHLQPPHLCPVTVSL